MEDDKCYISGCKRESSIIYLGRSLCDKHWEELCSKDEAKIKKLLNLKEKKAEKEIDKDEDV